MNYEALKTLCGKINCPVTYVESVVRELMILGVKELINDGPIEFMNIRLLGKGQNGFVFKCSLDYAEGYYACKIRRFDASRNDLLKEGYILRLANSVNVGPSLINFSRNLIIMELVKGLEFIEYVINHDTESVRRIIKDLLMQCHRLDLIGISHNELTRLREHVIVGDNGRVYIMDFESATFKGGANVPQVVNALIMGRGSEQKIIREKLSIDVDFNVIRELLHEYKRNPSQNLITELLKLLGIE